MRTFKTVILAQLALLLMTSVSPQSANAAAQRLASFPPDRRDPITIRCDQLADSNYDAQRVGSGVPFDKINVSEALPVCQRASARQPARPRYQYLYGRVLDSARRYAEAAQQYTAADQGGYPLAAAGLGMLYASGDGVAQDSARAAILFRRAGDEGLLDAYAYLGMLYVESTPPNYTQAFSEFDRAARAGSTLALTYLGEFYTNGVGIAKNQVRAIALFQQAANRGEPEGMLDLGLSYYSGAGVQRDPKTAFRWLSRAAEFGFAQAQDAIGHMYEEGDGVVQSGEQAIAWYRKSAVQNDPFAAIHLAQLLSNAGNDAEAMVWYQRAAANGDPASMTQLGGILSGAGRGAEAVDWYKKAAAKGFVDAENRLAYDYFVGKDTLSQDYAQAAYWYGKAVEQNDTFAMVRLGEMYENGQGIGQNIDEARQFYTRAAGDPDIPGIQARYNLAHLNGAPAPNDNGDLVSGGIITPPQGFEPAPASNDNDDLVSGGLITPPPDYEPAPQPRNDARRDQVVRQRDDTPEPQHGSLPTRPAARSSDDDLKAAIILGAIVIGGVWLLSGSSGDSSSAGLNSSPPPSNGGGFGGGSMSTSPAQPVIPVDHSPHPMTGNTGKILMGESGLGFNNVIRK